MSKRTENLPKGFYKTTFFIGLGFFTMGLMDPLYDTYVPIFLSRFVESKALIGSIMTLDNVFAILLIPIIAALSDRTRTSIGRRMPYIITLLPLAALSFGLIPYAAFYSLTLLIIAIFALNLFKQAVRGPVVALMPDITPGEFRSEANGVINTMGGIASIVGTIGLAQLMNISVPMPDGSMMNEVLAYPVAGVLVIIAVILLFLFVKEPRVEEAVAQPAGESATQQSTEKKPIWQSLMAIFQSSEKSALFVLLAIFFWFLGYQGILPYIGLYAKESLGFSTGLAALPAGAVGVAYALCAIPSGVIAHRIGRKRAIRAALITIVAILVVLFLHGGLVQNTGEPATMLVMALFLGLLFCFGIFWVTVVTNSFPMLWQMATYGDIGMYTGLYYMASQLAAIVAPPVTGGIIDGFGYRAIFLFAAICMGLAFWMMSFVRRGEASDVDSDGEKELPEVEA